jgi:hypothetical protein
MQQFLRSALVALAVIAASVIPFHGQTALADSWIDPERRIYESANRQFRLTIDPAEVDGSSEYVSEKLRRSKRPRSQPRAAPQAVLERRSPKGRWAVVWQAQLVNEIAPAHALVSDDGRHVVTFDNWFSIGHGDDVIVIYREDGSAVRALALTNLVPPIYKALLRHTVSSVDWSGDAGMVPGGEMMFVDVLVPHGGALYDKPTKKVRFAITLADGAVHLPDEASWASALATTRTLALAAVEAYLEWLAFLRDPLVAPPECHGWRWEAYLEEAGERLAPPGKDGHYPATHVLDPSDARMRGNALSFLNRSLTSPSAYEKTVFAAAPCDAGALERELAAMMPLVKPGSLARLTLYLSASREEFERTAPLFALSGARLAWLDPADPIEQLSERIPGPRKEQAARELYQRLLDGEIDMAIDDDEDGPSP